MLFSPGMVANYLVMTNLLQLKDTIWALILPLALGPFNILVMRTFFKKTVPDSIIESARIDGASEMRIFVSIVLPLAVPGIATISLFAALGYWNDWFNAYFTFKRYLGTITVFIDENSKQLRVLIEKYGYGCSSTRRLRRSTK